MGAPPPRLLIVDDNPDAREIYRASLEYVGFQCDEALDGEDAIARIHTAKPDLILMDAAMPRMDGWECARRLKADNKTRHIPVVILTAHVFAEHRARAAAIGVDGFLGKPVLPDALAREIRRILKRTPGRRRSPD